MRSVVASMARKGGTRLALMSTLLAYCLLMGPLLLLLGLSSLSSFGVVEAFTTCPHQRSRKQHFRSAPAPPTGLISSGSATANANRRRAISRTTSRTALFYQDDNGNNKQERRTNNISANRVIPVLGPLPGQKAPLLVGSQLVLSQPTVGQWNALEETVRIHQQHVLNGNSNNSGGIEASPLIAILDEYTTTSSSSSESSKKGRYATLAAVVGISSAASNDDSPTTTTSSFMESIRDLSNNNKAHRRPENSQIRLLGVGRALLSDVFQQVSSSQYDEDGHLLTPTGELMSDVEATDSNNNNNSHDNNNNQVLMARFGLVMDVNTTTRRAPVHALHQMSGLVFQIQSLHQDRRKLVAGIKAGKARLSQAASNQILDDLDGLGLLFEAKQQQNNNNKAASATANEQQESSVTVTLQWNDTPVARPRKRKNNKKTTNGASKTSSTTTSAPPKSSGSISDNNANGSSAMPPPEQQKEDAAASNNNATPPAAALVELDNYGLGTSASSFAKIVDLTKVYLEKLAPFYSPERCESEEHYYEMLSFVTCAAMDAYLKPAELAWALQCTDTVERLHQVYEWMWRHKRDLQVVADKVNDELTECGEECTDLW